MFNLGLRKNEKTSGYYVVYRPRFGITVDHYVGSLMEIENLLKSLERSELTSKEMSSIRIYTARNWRIHRLFFDKFGYVKLWILLSTILFSSFFFGLILLNILLN